MIRAAQARAARKRYRAPVLNEQSLRRFAALEAKALGLHPTAKRLMITADGGGSNGYRLRRWKVELKLADELKLPITVCHLPPGTRKWNKIEHRLFSFITINWRGKPLRSYRTIVQLIAATSTDAGLEVRAELDENKYPKGVEVSDTQMAAVNL